MSEGSSPQNLPRHAITPGQQIISACSGAIFTSLLTTPFDVVKVRLQVQQSLTQKPCYLLDCRCLDGVTICTFTSEGSHVNKFKGTFDAFLKIAKLEGIQSWWKGLSPALIMAIPMTVIYYTGYDQLKMIFGFKEGQRNVFAPAFAGGLARLVAVTTVCPIELIRTKLQSRRGYDYRELLSVIRNAIKKNGVLSLWRGLSPMLLRDIPFSFIYWVGYEFMKLQLSYSHIGSSFPYLVPFLSGCFSGSLSALITNPLDVMKTHMQVEIGQSATVSRTSAGSLGTRVLGTGSLKTVFGDVVTRHGYIGLYAGLIPRLAKITPACGIMIASYEMGKDYFSRQNSILYT